LSTARPLVRVMLRPKSLLLLVLALAVAVGFALFGQWQLGRAVQNGHLIERPTEDVVALADVATPQAQATEKAVGQLVSAPGSWVQGDFAVLGTRIDQGRTGFWTIGHFVTSDGASLAVGLGWTADEADARAVADAANAGTQPDLPTEVVGRYQHSEAPTIPEDLDALPVDMAVPALLNEWSDPGPTYAGYLTLRSAPAGLGDIYSPPAQVEVQLNFLNLFYAVEWAVFAVVALYVWYRLIRDVYEKERDEELERSGADRAGSEATVD